jgi:DNA-binding NarL/FixJ family response regulator
MKSLHCEGFHREMQMQGDRDTISGPKGKKLTQRQLRVCMLYYAKGMTQVIVGRRLGLRQSTISEHLAAARRRIPALPAPRGWSRRRVRQLF